MKRIKLLLGSMVLFLMVVCQPHVRENVNAATVLPTNVTIADEGNELVGISGSYATDIKKAIDLVNKYRKEACDKGYPNPDEPDQKLKPSDYCPIKWSSDLEFIARIRAAEATIYQEHERPNMKSCFSVLAANGVSSCAEVLAWGGSTISSSVSMWYWEKETWISGGKGVTGHYTSMIAPSNTYMGMANFNGTGAGEFTGEYSNEFSETGKLDETPMATSKNVIQTVEVKKNRLSNIKVSITNSLSFDKNGLASLQYKYGNRTVYYLGDVKWTCNSNKIELLSDGTIKAKKYGKFKITFSYSGAKSGKVTKTIKCIPKTPTVLLVKRKGTKATLKFKPTKNVSGYQIEYSWGTSIWSRFPNRKVIQLKGTSKTIKKLKKNYLYSFRFRSYKKVGKKKYYSKWTCDYFSYGK